MSPKRPLQTLRALPLWLLVALSCPTPAAAAVFTVTSSADGGAGTLRNAINLANLTPEADLIVFATGAATISVGSPLPALTDNGIEIRGDTGPITLSDLGGVPSGITVNADSCVIRGMTITGFGIGIRLISGLATCRHNLIGGLVPGHGNTLTNNGTGILLDGVTVRRNIVLGNTVDQNTSSGIELWIASDNVIGPSNVVTRSGGHGIYLHSQEALRDTITGNHVGTDAASTSGLGNTGDGIRVEGALCQENLIENNVVVDNGERGIHFTDFAQYNVARSNLVGWIASGSRPNQWGISATINADFNVIGPDNVVSGNTLHGVELNQVQDCRVTDNIIGLDSGGGAGFGNGQAGVFADMGPNEIDRNVISGNGTHGIHADGPWMPPGFLSIFLNYIGTDASGNMAVGNTQSGIFVTDAFTSNSIIDNLVSGNGQAGIYLDNLCSDHVVQRNLIGADVTGSIGRPNDVGMVIRSSNNTIGGSFASGEGNTIRFNTQDGIQVLDATLADADTNWVWSNTIESNGANGIWFRTGASTNLVGEDPAVSLDKGNVIANNGGHGVRVGEASCLGDCPVGNRVLTNSIFGNTGDAIDLFSSLPPGNYGIPSPTILGATSTQVWGVSNLGGLATQVQVFKDAENETQTYLGDVMVSSGSYFWSLTVSLSAGDIVTATNTANYPTTPDPRHTSQPADTMSVSGGSASIAYSGLINTALGGATFALTAPLTSGPGLERTGAPDLPRIAASQRLIVSNIGSSGEDGVAINFGRGDGGTVTWSSGDFNKDGPRPEEAATTGSPDAVPTGTSLTFDAFGTVNGMEDQPVGTVSLTEGIDLLIWISADYTPIGLATQRVEVLIGGSPVGVAPAAGIAVGKVDAFPASCRAMADYTPGPPLPGWPAQGPTRPLPALIYEWEAPATFDLPGLGGPMLADEIRIVGDLGSAGFTTEVSEISRLEIQVLAAPGPGAVTELVLTDESARRFGRSHWGAGQALLEFGAPMGAPVSGLRISNIGSSGEDGVHIPYDEYDLARRVRWARLDGLGTVPAGARVSFESRGTMGGVPGQRVSRAELVRRPADYEASADHAAMSPTSVRIEVWDDTDIVHTSSVPGATAMVYLSDEPVGGGRGLDCAVEFEALADLEVAVPGGPMVMGDLIRFVPEGASVEPTDWDDHLYLAKNIPGGELILTAEPNTVGLGGGFSARSVGNTNLLRAGPAGEVLRLSNLGMYGNGFMLDQAAPTPAMNLEWAPLGPPPPQQQAAPEGYPVGTGTGAELRDRTVLVGHAHPMQTASILQDGEYQLTGDLGGLGATMMTLRAYDGGMLVGQMMAVPNGVIGAVDRSIVGGGIVIDGAGTPNYWLELLPGTMLTLGPLIPPAGGKEATAAAVQADRLIIVPEDPLKVATGVVGLGLFPFNLRHVVVTGFGTAPPVDVPRPERPTRTWLHAAAPNPSGGRTRLQFDLARGGEVALRVFDASGRRIATLASGRFEPGRHSVQWEGADAAGRRAAPGIYFVRLEAPGYTAARKLVRIE